MTCGYSKDPSRRDGSFEHPKHMFQLMDKKLIAILRYLCLLNWLSAAHCTVYSPYSSSYDITFVL